ncbi:alpha/beta hydrolase [Bacillus licheniformis]
MRKMNNRQRSSRGFLLDLKNIDDLSFHHLKEISCPVLIMHCRYDRVVPAEHAFHAKKLIPFSEVYQADSWGHLIWLGTEGKSVSQKVISFLKTTSS